MASSTTANAQGKLQLENTSKRDALMAYESRFQKEWAESHVFEIDPPEGCEHMTPAEMHAKYPKFFGCMAYPYMNGTLHLGHAFTATKIEFATGYERLQGKRALFPMGFHCTGMPIRANADKLQRELEMFGNDLIVPEETEVQASDKAPGEAREKVDPTKFQAKKSKAVAKTSALKYQFQIMESSGVPHEMIPQFADANKWLEYYPEKCKEDCTRFGMRIDWRRQFITTDANPYYDAFIRWQMNKLHFLNKVKFGERYTIFSAKDGQPCMDHDRKEGEGIGPQEYTAIKMRVMELSSRAEESLANIPNIKGKSLFLLAATLRPETMYGQTNCYVGPRLEYGIYESNVPGELFVCTPRAAQNLAYQKFSPERGVIRQVATISGDKLVGTSVRAPYSVYDIVRVLPMDTVLSTKGTGVVTSVPSDSPDDYATYTDLRKKPDFYGIDAEWVKPEIVAIIRTPTYGDMCAQELCKTMKINSPKDTAALAKAKELAYKEGFYQGVMLMGKYEGEKVEVAKSKVRDDMIAESLAFVYNEPEGRVISRSGDECCVALCDQWYMDYGEEEWKKETESLLEKMDTFSLETRNSFKYTLNWLNQWACARSYGLGTRLPWDPQFLVESLTDSTIYMAYYTICHHLHSTINGSQLGDFGITPEQMTEEVWEYVMRRGPYPSKSDISREHLERMRGEFEYFYPINMRVSGKDLINNHLTFWIYTHAALFPEDLWPVGVRTNGHLLLNGEKMSKATGNFITMRDACLKFGTDAVRVALADSGDGMEDANFEEATANAAILRLYTLDQWMQEVLTNIDSYRKGEKNFHDKAFENEINDLIRRCNTSYKETNYKEALRSGFYEFMGARDWYREVTVDVGMHGDLLRRWIEVQTLLLSPIAPHITDHIWQDLLGKKTTIQNARFPEPSFTQDSVLTNALGYLRGLARDIHVAESQQIKKQKKGKGVAFDPHKPRALSVYVSANHPEWQQKYVDLVRQHYDEASNTVDDKSMMPQIPKGPEMKKAMLFVQTFKKQLLGRSEHRSSQEIFDRKLGFDEYVILQASLPYLKNTAGVTSVSLIRVQNAESGITQEGKTVDVSGNTFAAAAEPGQPAFLLENVTEA